MPSYGIAPIVQSWLTKWEQAQAARYNAWTGASSVLDGATGVLGTVGTMLKGAAPATDSAFSAIRGRLLGLGGRAHDMGFAANTQRAFAGPETPAIQFK